jgi:hypothetical protein
MGHMLWSRADLKDLPDKGICGSRLSERSRQTLTSEHFSVLRSEAAARHEA